MATAAATRTFKCVPFDKNWGLPSTKLDLKAIYRRPRRTVGEYDEVVQERGPDGQPLYDLVGPLPVRRHSDWLAKGFEYVTVVAVPGAEDHAWGQVAASLRAKGLDPKDYIQHPQLGTWNPKLYLATADQVDLDKFAELRALVEQLGSATVLQVKRSDDPTFTLPKSLQDIPPGGKAKTVHPTLDSGAPVYLEPGERVVPLVDAKPAAARWKKKTDPEVQG